MMVHLYDYSVPVAEPEAGISDLRAKLAGLPTAEQKALLTGIGSRVPRRYRRAP